MNLKRLGMLAAAAAAALTITASAAGTLSLNGGVVNVDTSLNLRAEPSASALCLDSAANGSKLIVLSDIGVGWYQVSFQGSTGYMSGKYIVLGSVDGDFGTGYVNGSNVNVRSAASTDSGVVAQYSSGKTVSIIGVCGEWYKITDGSTIGYMRSDFVALDSSKVELGSGTVNGTGVRLRAEASTEASVLTQYNTGKVLELVSAAGDWYQVSDGANIGYIHKDYIVLGGTATPAANYSAGQLIVDTAMKYLGVPYVYGGTSPSCFDCSGLVYYVYRENGYSITRRASTIWYDGVTITKDQLAVGDCVFFSSDYSSSIEHVGIYIGNGQFIHASSGGGCVKINSLSDAYYLRNYYGACRVL